MRSAIIAATDCNARTHKLFTSVPTISSELLHYLRHGRITPRPDVARFDGHRVEFVDGSAASYDLVVCATGFNLDFPFLPEGLVPIRDGVAPLYGGVVLRDYKHLYIASAIHPIYGFGPVISVGGGLLATLIPLQDRLALPLGRDPRSVRQEAGDDSSLTSRQRPFGSCAGRAGFYRWSPLSSIDDCAARSLGRLRRRPPTRRANRSIPICGCISA